MKKILAIVLVFWISACFSAPSFLWKNKNQVAYDTLKKGDAKKAARLFTDKSWQSIANYRAKDYAQAKELLSHQKPSLESLYNLGNTLAQLGQYQDAIAAYDKALAFKADDSDTLHNKKLLEELLKQQQKQQNNKDKQDKKRKKQNQKDKQQENNQQQNKNQQDKDKSKKNKNNKDTQSEQDKKNKKDSDKQESKKKQTDKKERQQNMAQSNALKEKQQVQAQQLRRIPDNPHGLLQQKFIRDYLKRHPEAW